MKLQHLTIIFIIIIVPISLVLSTYINSHIDTIRNQTSYDSSLINASYDGIKAFQLNTANNSYSTIGNSKIRDIEAAISTFFSSLATNLGSSGYSEDDIRQHVPAILFNLYDGYYIYSNYYDTVSGTYKYGLKPFMYYSCRYVEGSNNDFVVNYTLDNTITVIGIVNGNYVTRTGHLILDDVFSPNTEILTEELITLDNQGTDTSHTRDKYQYIIYNSQKIYKENNIDSNTPDRERYFYYSSTYSKDYVNDLETIQYLNSHLDSNNNLYSDSAQKYYQEAREFTNWVTSNLSGITQDNAVDVDGNQITDFATDTGTNEIFAVSSDNNPLQSGSTFNENRLSVIRHSIETNLVAAITNFTNHSIIGYEFALSQLGEEDWYKIEHNISILTFLQGFPIGGKIYNNYCVISNDSNQETVGNDSIYIIDNTGTYHKPGCKTLIDELKNTYPNNTSQWSDALVPVSSNGITNHNSPNFNIFTSSGIRYPDKTNENGYVTTFMAFEEDRNPYNSYIAFDVFFKNDSGSPVSDNLYFDYGTEVTMEDQSDEEMVGLLNSTRVGIVKIGSTSKDAPIDTIQNLSCNNNCYSIIYEPNSTSHTDLSIERATKYGLNLVNGRYYETYAFKKAGGPVFVEYSISALISLLYSF